MPRSKTACSNQLETPWKWDVPRNGWSALEVVPTYGPGASEHDQIPANAPLQREIPTEYRLASADELHERIRAAKAALGSRVIILGHHYQRDEIIAFADALGDSFKLAQHAAAHPEADYIVFCGVHFMAESADILRSPHQQVVLPNLAAGCSMADMAQLDDVLDAWDALVDVLGETDEAGRSTVLPVTYMNSSAALKAFCGEHGGIACTSSNAEAVLEWAWQRSQRILFFPDEHLGRNTASALGAAPSEMVIWDRRREPSAEAIERARIVLWRGWCSVHTRFTVEQLARARAEDPSVRILVHPECPKPVVDAADLVGSTEFIISEVRKAPPGTHWAVGTEINLVNRLQQEHPEQRIECLDPVICPCSTMYRIHPAYLAWVLERLVDGEVVNRITVPESVTHWAKVALDRMLGVPPSKSPVRIGASR